MDYDGDVMVGGSGGGCGLQYWVLKLMVQSGRRTLPFLLPVGAPIRLELQMTCVLDSFLMPTLFLQTWLTVKFLFSISSLFSLPPRGRIAAVRIESDMNSDESNAQLLAIHTSQPFKRVNWALVLASLTFQTFAETKEVGGRDHLSIYFR